MVAPIAFWLAEFRRRRPQCVHAWQDATNLHRGRGGVARGRAAHRAEHAQRAARTIPADGSSAICRQAIAPCSAIPRSCSATTAGPVPTTTPIGSASSGERRRGLQWIDFEQLAQGVDPGRVRERPLPPRIPHDAPIVGSAFDMSEEKRPLLWVESRRGSRAPRHAHALHRLRRWADAGRHDPPRRAPRHRGPAPPARPRDRARFVLQAMNVAAVDLPARRTPDAPLEPSPSASRRRRAGCDGVASAVLAGTRNGWAVRDANAAGLADRVHVLRLSSACMGDRGRASRGRSS